MATYTVKKGDTLSEIAQKHLSGSGYTSTYAYTNRLAELNNIKNPDYIVVGQVIKLDGEVETVKTNTTSRATIRVFGLQSNTDRTMYVTWTWDKSNTENYQVIWYYDTGDGVWFIGSDNKVTDKQSLYTAPGNALKVKVKIKPISKTHKVDDKDTHYWTAGWSTEKQYAFSDNPPTTPSGLKVTIEDFTLTATLSNLDVNADSIQFEVVKDDAKVCNTGKATIITSSASYSCTISKGSKYKVRCRSVRGKLNSEWSDYSDNIGTAPSVPTGIITCKATSEKSVYLEWKGVNNAKTYDLEYTTKKSYFDGSDQTTTVSSIELTHYEKTGLTSGEEYFFRVRAVNDEGHSGWSSISSVIIGKEPSAPTTWSSTTTAIVGEPLTLYWIHNSEDGSEQKYAEVELDIGGIIEVHTIRNELTEEGEEDIINYYSINTSDYIEGMTISWRVRTSGISNSYGDWSIQRTVDIYAPPVAELTVTDHAGLLLETLETFPFYISVVASPKTQKPTGYHITITTRENYETVDNMGNIKYVNKGDSVFSKHYDVTDDEIMVEMSAGNLSLENNMHYVISCDISMDSGLTASALYDFNVGWTEEEFEPNAEIGVDMDTLTAHIRPFCMDRYGQLIDGITLSVYRREFDGAFTELANDLINTRNTFITDPHPALDFARYRIVAKTDNTGTVSYYDIPGYPVGGKSVVIQWDEDWSGFDVTEDDEREQRPWTGSILKLPYNIDVSDSNKPDIALIEYIGQKYPVSYYGTQLGASATWNVTIPKHDKETLYALRRLSNWMGDAYVREPSGSGYWANITVSFNQKHLATVIPVTLNLTRVSGGI